MGENATWTPCIQTKYNSAGGAYLTLPPKGSFGMGLQDIEREACRLKQNCVRVREQDENQIWEDVWYGSTPLSEGFPKLYNIVGSKAALVINTWMDQDGLGV